MWCEGDEGSPPWRSEVALNPYEKPWQLRMHDPVFSAFRPWRGTWPASDVAVDFLGVFIHRSAYCNWAYLAQRHPYAIRVRMCQLQQKLRPGTAVQLSWPLVSEEYFEYVDVLTVVREYVGHVLLHTGSAAIRGQASGGVASRLELPPPDSTPRPGRAALKVVVQWPKGAKTPLKSRNTNCGRTSMFASEFFSMPEMGRRPE